MILIQFPDRETEIKGLAFLVGRFSGKVLRRGLHIVPESALPALAAQNIPYAVKGRREDGGVDRFRLHWGGRVP